MTTMLTCDHSCELQCEIFAWSRQAQLGDRGQLSGDSAHCSSAGEVATRLGDVSFPSSHPADVELLVLSVQVPTWLVCGKGRSKSSAALHQLVGATIPPRHDPVAARLRPNGALYLVDAGERLWNVQLPTHLAASDAKPRGGGEARISRRKRRGPTVGVAQVHRPLARTSELFSLLQERSTKAAPLAGRWHADLDLGNVVILTKGESNLSCSDNLTRGAASDQEDAALLHLVQEELSHLLFLGPKRIPRPRRSPDVRDDRVPLMELAAIFEIDNFDLHLSSLLDANREPPSPTQRRLPRSARLSRWQRHEERVSLSASAWHQGADQPEQRQEDADKEHDPVSLANRHDAEREEQHHVEHAPDGDERTAVE